MRIDHSSSEGFAAMLASCSPSIFQGNFDEAMAAGNPPKRPFYSLFESSDDTADEDAADDQYSEHQVQKKRRLSVDQVRSLEKNFEEENKLDPERKLQLARELGLHPRQVAVWFQNRRARWKSKQLEKDYDILKADYDALKCEYEAAIQEREKLQTQILHLNEKLQSTDGNDQKLWGETATFQVLQGSPLQTQIQLSNESADQSSLGSLMSSSPLAARKRGFSSSNSDDSEVLDHVESPALSLHHPIPSCLEHANNQLDCAHTPSLISIGRQEHPIPTQRPNNIVKLEDESFPEESSNYLFTMEADQATGFPWWDWS